MKAFHPLILTALLANPLAAAAQNFTTAAEVKPILQATKGNWVAVREFNGQDQLSFTQLESWRCGLEQVRYFINEGKPLMREMEPCYEDTPTPNAMKLDGHLPYNVHKLGTIDTVTIEVTYDDGSIERETFERANIMTP